ncbi:MAG: hypothetical protein JWR88_283, partial [Pseudonocardia sp.]|nr:hypothetical protein [Pseudonocardia sp.]
VLALVLAATVTGAVMAHAAAAAVGSFAAGVAGVAGVLPWAAAGAAGAAALVAVVGLMHARAAPPSATASELRYRKALATRDMAVAAMVAADVGLVSALAGVGSCVTTGAIVTLFAAPAAAAAGALGVALAVATRVIALADATERSSPAARRSGRPGGIAASLRSLVGGRRTSTSSEPDGQLEQDVWRVVTGRYEVQFGVGSTHDGYPAKQVAEGLRQQHPQGSPDWLVKVTKGVAGQPTDRLAGVLDQLVVSGLLVARPVSSVLRYRPGGVLGQLLARAPPQTARDTVRDPRQALCGVMSLGLTTATRRLQAAAIALRGGRIWTRPFIGALPAFAGVYQHVADRASDHPYLYAELSLPRQMLRTLDLPVDLRQQRPPPSGASDVAGRYLALVAASRPVASRTLSLESDPLDAAQRELGDAWALFDIGRPMPLLGEPNAAARSAEDGGRSPGSAGAAPLSAHRLLRPVAGVVARIRALARGPPRLWITRTAIHRHDDEGDDHELQMDTPSVAASGSPAPRGRPRSTRGARSDAATPRPAVRTLVRRRLVRWPSGDDGEPGPGSPVPLRGAATRRVRDRDLGRGLEQRAGTGGPASRSPGHHLDR